VSLKRTVSWGIALVICFAIAGGLIWYFLTRHRVIVLQGAILVQDSDVRKERPIAGVEVTAIDSLRVESVKSDSSGLFLIALHEGAKRGDPILLKFSHPDFRFLEQREFVGDKLYVIHMVPRAESPADAARPPTNVSNVTVRYSVKTTTSVNIGSAVKTFQVENHGNVPCRNQHPCSPDGKWKAALGSTTLDAGAGNEFRDARVSCIAGPCPFTKIESEKSIQGGQIITLVRDRDILVRGRSAPHHADRRRPRILSGHFWWRAQLYLTRQGGRNYGGGGRKRAESFLSSRTRDAVELGQLQRDRESGSDESCPLRT